MLMYNLCGKINYINQKVIQKEFEMKQNCYKVSFVTGKAEIIWAFNFTEAQILGQAEQIKQGNDYTVKVIVNLADNTSKWFN